MEATRKAVEATAGVEKDPDLNKYKESLRKAYGYLKLEALDPGFDHRMQLWRVFVPQRVSKGIPERELPKDFAKPEHAASALLAGEILGGPSEPEPVLEVLDRDANRLTVVVGDPGSGKSTLVQYLCLRWAQENRRELPILVELRKYASDKNAPRDFLSYLYSGASTIWQFDQHQLDDKLKAGDALVIFDGLDEVVDRAQRETVITEIIRFSAQYNHPQIIITSRITGYQRARLSDAGFQHFTLQDFDDNEIKTFIEKWHQIAFSNPDDRTRLNHRLRESISGSQRIRELASNPLLLTLMAILNRNQKLPDERWELYARASEILLGKWDLGKFLTSEPGRDSISLKEKLGMLRSIAKYMQASPEGLKTNLIHRDQLEGVLVLYLGSLGDVQHPRALARLMMDELRERNFVLCFSEDEFYSFVHRTFLEYFCAQYFRFSVVEDQTLTMHDLRTLFLTHWEDDSWKEVLHLIVGMIGLPRSKDLTECLLDHPLQGSGQAMALAFAAECFAEIVERAKVPELAQRLRSAIAGLRDSAFGFPLFIAVASAVNVWGPDEDNRQLVLSATKATRKRNERRIGLYLWAYNWPNDPDLASFMGRLITADDVMDDLMGRTEILHEGLED
jgi:GTPase SAR1 family protein